MSKKRVGLSRKERKAKKDKKRLYVIGGIMVFLMIVSVAGIIVGGTGTQSATNTFSYQGFNFKLEEVEYLGGQQAFTASFDGPTGSEEVYFYNLPQDTIRVRTQGNLTPVIGQNDIIGISSNPTDRLAPAYDLIGFDLALLSGKQIFTGTTTLVPGFEQLPVITCEDAINQSSPLIVLEEAAVNESTEIIVDGPCVTIRMLDQDVTRVRDRLLFTMRGVITTR